MKLPAAAGSFGIIIGCSPRRFKSWQEDVSHFILVGTKVAVRQTGGSYAKTTETSSSHSVFLCVVRTSYIIAGPYAFFKLPALFIRRYYHPHHALNAPTSYLTQRCEAWFRSSLAREPSPSLQLWFHRIRRIALYPQHFPTKMFQVCPLQSNTTWVLRSKSVHIRVNVHVFVYINAHAYVHTRVHTYVHARPYPHTCPHSRQRQRRVVEMGAVSMEATRLEAAVEGGGGSRTVAPKVSFPECHLFWCPTASFCAGHPPSRPHSRSPKGIVSERPPSLSRPIFIPNCVILDPPPSPSLPLSRVITDTLPSSLSHSLIFTHPTASSRAHAHPPFVPTPAHPPSSLDYPMVSSHAHTQFHLPHPTC